MASVQADDGVRIAYRAAGEGPLTVLFLHGWGGSGAYFGEVLGHLDLAGLRAVTLDLRGHGDSDKPGHGYTDERLARDALAVADAARAGPVAAVGFSMGG